MASPARPVSAHLGRGGAGHASLPALRANGAWRPDFSKEVLTQRLPDSFADTAATEADDARLAEAPGRPTPRGAGEPWWPLGDADRVLRAIAESEERLRRALDASSTARRAGVDLGPILAALNEAQARTSARELRAEIDISQIVTAIHQRKVEVDFAPVVQEIRTARPGSARTGDFAELQKELREIKLVLSSISEAHGKDELRRDAAREAEAVAALQSEVEAKPVVDFSPVLKAIEGRRPEVDLAPVLQAIAALKSEVEAKPVVNVQASRPEVDFSPVLKAIEARRPELDLAPVLQAVAALKSEVEAKPVINVQASRPEVDFGPVLKAIEASRPNVDFGPVLEAIAAQRPEVDLGAVLRAIEGHRPDVDLAPMLKAIKESRAEVDLGPVLRAVAALEARAAEGADRGGELVFQAVEEVRTAVEVSPSRAGSPGRAAGGGEDAAAAGPSVVRMVAPASRLPLHAVGRPTLRFPVGARVECLTNGDQWRLGTVVRHWFSEPSWQPGAAVPYGIKLDGGQGQYIWAPRDTDACVRAPPPPREAV